MQRAFEGQILTQRAGFDCAKRRLNLAEGLILFHIKKNKMVMLNNIDISKLALLNLTYHLVKTKSKKIIYGFYLHCK